MQSAKRIAPYRAHMEMTKSYAIGLIKQYGTGVLKGFTGTPEEAIEAIRKDPREYFPIGDCDNQDETGRCLGHDTTESESEHD